MPRTTTRVSRRHGPLVPELGFSSRFVSGPIQPEPAVASVPPRPHGDLTAAPTDRLVDLAQSCWDGGRDTLRARRQAMQAALAYLAGFEGDTWQQRWDTSPVGRGEVSCHDLETDRPMSTGFWALFCFRAVRPSLLALRRCTLHAYAPFFIAAQQDPLLEKFAAHVGAQDVKFDYQRQALLDIACLLTVQGVSLADVTPPALLHFAHENRQVIAELLPGAKKSDQFLGQLAWRVLVEMGQFPPGTPPTLRASLLRGPLTVEQMVDRYTITNQSVRALLIDYLQRRAADTDYSSLNSLVLALAHHFWEKIETLSPGQADLRIAPEVYATWRGQVSVRATASPGATSSTSSSRSAASTTTCTPGPRRNPNAGARGWRPVRCRPAS